MVFQQFQNSDLDQIWILFEFSESATQEGRQAGKEAGSQIYFRSEKNLNSEIVKTTRLSQQFEIQIFSDLKRIWILRLLKTQGFLNNLKFRFFRSEKIWIYSLSRFEETQNFEIQIFSDLNKIWILKCWKSLVFLTIWNSDCCRSENNLTFFQHMNWHCL